MVQPPKTRTAFIVQGPGIAKPMNVSLPALSPTNVLVKTACVGLNPLDVRMARAGVPQGSMAGIDFAGEVVSVGSQVSSKFQPGDRVCGAAHGYNENNDGTGAFAEYVLAEEHTIFQIPDGISFQEAATLPCGLLTCGIVLQQSMRLKDVSRDKDRHVLVNGGSTSSGLFMIQLLRHYGFTPVATCSPHNFNLVKGAGAVALFDYKSPTCAADIREFTKNRLAYAADCITTVDSMKICYDALGADGGRYVALESFPVLGHSRRSVRPSWVFAINAFGCGVDWFGPYRFEPSQADRDFAEAWIREAAGLLWDGVIKPLPYRIIGETLEAVDMGLDELAKGQVSGTKLVCIANKSMVVS